MTFEIQRYQIGWSALAAALLVVLALIWNEAWLLSLGSLVTIGTLLLAWWSDIERRVLAAVIGATALGITQALIPLYVRWGNGLVLIAMLLVAATMAFIGGEPHNGNRSFRNLSLSAMLLAYLSAQASYFAAIVVPGLPSSQQQLLPFVERGTLGALGLLIFFMIRQALVRQHHPLVRRLALGSTLAYVLYLGLALSPLWTHRAPGVMALLGASSAVWSLLVALVVAVVHLPNKAPLAPPVKGESFAGWRVTLNDYLILMKYRVALLLLLTTLGAMIIAAQGWPGSELVAWVMLGGLLSVGGAGALNHYLDRDIDLNMGRTSSRPIPAGRMAPRQALLFGLTLSVLQFLIFWFHVNPLTAWLSLAGLLYYVIIYTIWLKRKSTQNIVIGGAAGAFPPLVGWAAVTGDLSLGAFFLFAVVFYWTPPHFWALALMRKEDYARARVPMLPVVMGEEETRRQILLYSLLMVALTLVVVPLQVMGLLYLLVALLLNGKFLWDAVRLYRRPSKRAALTLYKYSLLYLALLFAAMAADRVLLA